MRRHVDQILVRAEDKELTEVNIPELPPVPMSPSEAVAASEIPASVRNSSAPEGNVQDNATPSGMDTRSPETVIEAPLQQTVAPARRSQRAVSKPSYLKDYEC